MPDTSHRFYALLPDWLRTRFARHLSRFAGVALVSLLTTQIVLAIAYQIVRTGGAATAIGWMAGVGVSYLLSRRAWDRRGRPKLLRETLPFALISVGTLTVMTVTGHFASVYANSRGYGHLRATLIVNGSVLFANVFTFISRFLIFHYVLFANRQVPRRPPAPPPVEAEVLPDRVPVTRAPGDEEGGRR